VLARINHELKEHFPFTLFGAATGIVLILIAKKIPHQTAFNIFYILHPTHVVLSALVTASMFERYRCGRFGRKCSIGLLLFVGYIGSVGIATLSDSLIPYWGETLLDMPHRHVHIGFIEKWWLINPLAFLGVAIAYFRPSTKMPHAGHVLISTWASLFHILMAMGGQMHSGLFFPVFIFLFLSVWLPCCVSDIVFPLLFTGKKNREDPKHSSHTWGGH